MPILTLPRLHLIGAGRLGRTLARLWQAAGQVQVDQIVTRHADSSAAAIDFIGAGRAASLAELGPAELILLATPDDLLAPVAAELAASRPSLAGSVVFHASGSRPAELLAPLRDRGAAIASVHPLLSFAEPSQALHDFAGCYCGCEGDPAALARLGPLFDAIGARRFTLDAAQKPLYHAAAVFACNDLVALMEAAQRCLEAAGVERATGWAALQPLIQATLANIGRVGPRAALTGPVARGDSATVASQGAAVARLDPASGHAYRALGQLALELAPLDPSSRARMAQALAGDTR
ncbi:Rossmann-like and DUF2520 domain-containing protein [Chitinimonas lacunae]|uniref:Rossmann-like and DUF2520 domain-containing protein n=1 Tax=Chitinimonas lacunae TaxID=1963018 RepID=A0ABV8MUQ2_9NEIS